MAASRPSRSPSVYRKVLPANTTTCAVSERKSAYQPPSGLRAAAKPVAVSSARLSGTSKSTKVQTVGWVLTDDSETSRRPSLASLRVGDYEVGAELQALGEQSSTEHA